MTKLDETGLEAAREACEGLLISHDISDGDLAAVITAYLDATRTSAALRDLQRLGQECEGDRLAVVVSAVREDQGGSARLLSDGETMDDDDWRDMESFVDAEHGPLRRQIVRCNLLRPEPVAEVVGRVEE